MKLSQFCFSHHPNRSRCFSRYLFWMYVNGPVRYLHKAILTNKTTRFSNITLRINIHNVFCIIFYSMRFITNLQINHSHWLLFTFHTSVSGATLDIKLPIVCQLAEISHSGRKMNDVTVSTIVAQMDNCTETQLIWQQTDISVIKQLQQFDNTIKI